MIHDVIRWMQDPWNAALILWIYAGVIFAIGATVWLVLACLALRDSLKQRNAGQRFRCFIAPFMIWREER